MRACPCSCCCCPGAWLPASQHKQRSTHGRDGMHTKSRLVRRRGGAMCVTATGKVLPPLGGPPTRRIRGPQRAAAAHLRRSHEGDEQHARGQHSCQTASSWATHCCCCAVDRWCLRQGRQRARGEAAGEPAPPTTPKHSNPPPLFNLRELSRRQQFQQSLHMATPAWPRWPLWAHNVTLSISIHDGQSRAGVRVSRQRFGYQLVTQAAARRKALHQDRKTSCRLMQFPHQAVTSAPRPLSSSH
jgi:hypothetical protein